MPAKPFLHRLVPAVALATVAILLPASAASGTPPLRPKGVLRYDGPGGGPDYSTAVAVSNDGKHVYVAGSTYGGPSRGDDYTLIAYGPTGQQRWIASYNGPDSNIDQALDVAVSPSGDRVFVTGYSFGSPATTNDATTLAFDGTTGERLWVARYDGPGHDTDVGAEVAVSPDGQTVFVTGASAGADGALDVLTVAYDSATGSQDWAARFGEGNAASDEGLAIGVSPDAALVYVTGYSTAQTADFLTVAYVAGTGVESWSRAIDAGGDELGRAIAVAPDGSAVFVTGYRSGAPGTGNRPLACSSGGAGVGDDYITVAYQAATGARRWLRNYDGPDQDCDEAYGIAIAPDGSHVFVTGSSFSLTTDSDAATVAYGAAAGNEVWAARFDGPDHLYDSGDSLVVAPDGATVYMAGSSVSSTTDFDFIVLFYETEDGNLLRKERYDGPGHGFDASNAIAIHPTGRLVYVTGGSTGPNLDPDFATIAYDTR